MTSGWYLTNDKAVIMIAQHYKDMLGAKSVIRQISEWSTARGAEIGYENVFDYSLGNPSVPCPPQFTAACENLLQSTDPVTLHATRRP